MYYIDPFDPSGVWTEGRIRPLRRESAPLRP